MNLEPTRLFTTLIERLSDVPGVVAAAAFDESGFCLSCFVGDPLEAMGAGRVIPVLQELAAPSDANAPFDEGVTFVERHLVRVLVRRAHSSTLIVLVDPEADVDLVVAYLGRAVDQVSRASRPPPAPTPNAPSAAPEDARATSGFYSRETEDSGARKARDSVPPERVMEDVVLEHLRALVLDTMGFGAEVAFDHARGAVGTMTGQVPRARYVELVGRLASDIEDDESRSTFVSRALVLPTRTRESDALDLLSPLARWVVERRTG